MKASEIIRNENKTSVRLPNGMIGFVVSILDIPAKYIGSDTYFSYWKDCFGRIYGTL